MYFGCSDNCTEDNLYRIIGVIPTQSSENGEYENRIKLIKLNYYTEEESGLLKNTYSSYPAGGGTGKGYYWGTSGNGNNWESSGLQSHVLNGVYWNSLKEYQDFIDFPKWYLGATSTNKVTKNTSNHFYIEERSNIKSYSSGKTFYVEKIGLIYPSDYGYSIGYEYQEESVYDNGGKYISNAWLYNLEKKYYEWAITPMSNADGNIRVCAIDKYGTIAAHIYAANTSIVLGIRPTFYLKSNVKYRDGDGTISNSYRIAL